MRAFITKSLGLILVIAAIGSVAVAQLAGDALDLQAKQLTSIPFQAKLPTSTSGAIYCPYIGDGGAVEMQNLQDGQSMVRAQPFNHDSSLQTLDGYARQKLVDGKDKPYADAAVLNWASSPVIAHVTQMQQDSQIGMPCSPAVSDAWALVGLNTTLGHKASVVITNFDTSETSVSLRFTTPKGLVELSIANRILVEPQSYVTLELDKYVPDAQHVGVFVQARSGRVLVHGVQQRFEFDRSQANPKMGKAVSYQIIPATMRTSEVLFIPAVPEYDTTLSAEQIEKARLEQQAALDKAHAEQAAKEAVEAKKEADKAAKKGNSKGADKDGKDKDGKGEDADSKDNKPATEEPDPITANPNQVAAAVTAQLVIANPSDLDTVVNVTVGDANASPNALLKPIAVPAGTSTVVPLDQISTKAVTSLRLHSQDEIVIAATVEYDNGQTLRVVPSISEISNNWSAIATAGSSLVLFNPNVEPTKVTTALNSVETSHVVEPFATKVIELTDVGSFYLLADKNIAMAIIGGLHKTSQDVFIGHPNITGGGFGLTAVRNPLLITKQAMPNEVITGGPNPADIKPTPTSEPIMDLDKGLKPEAAATEPIKDSKPAPTLPSANPENTPLDSEIEKNIESSTPLPTPAETDANTPNQNETGTPVPEESIEETTSDDIFG